ncbi:MAG: hypothetical protein JSV52_03485 [Candidatus Zixiibacteriota bacterium]|nr:MAG: hypothetical protein JSV52_03485 [candidate division Zixibacteria bacterium]
MTKPAQLLLIVSLAVATITYSDDSQQLDLKILEGEWEGDGEFLMPVTDIPMSVEGQAQFVWDSVTGRLRTALTAEKFLFTYSDSGYLVLDSRTDSISWEVWDNFGKHAKYYGQVSGKKVVGNRYRRGNHYQVVVELVTNDSIDFRLTVTEPDSNQFNRAVFNLWRVKK